MQIITPVYPHQNSTFNVSKSTKTILLEEIERGSCPTLTFKYQVFGVKLLMLSLEILA